MNRKTFTGDGYEVEDRGGDTLEVDLYYPTQSRVKKVSIDLVCVRSADSLIIHFCHERDVWVISRRLGLGYEKSGAENIDYEQVNETVELALIPTWTNDTEEAGKRIITREKKGVLG